MSNVEVVKRLYEAFGRRDQETIRALFDAEIEWVQTEGFPGGGVHHGTEAVLNDVFAKFRKDWDVWQAIVNEWLDAGEAVIALGEYRGTYRKTGRSTRATFAHVYRVRNGKIVRFEQYTDTLKVAEAMQPREG